MSIFDRITGRERKPSAELERADRRDVTRRSSTGEIAARPAPEAPAPRRDFYPSYPGSVERPLDRITTVEDPILIDSAYIEEAWAGEHGDAVRAREAARPAPIPVNVTMTTPGRAGLPGSGRRQIGR